MAVVSSKNEDIQILLKNLGLPTENILGVTIHILPREIVYADVKIVLEIDFESKELQEIVERYEFVKKETDGKD